MRADYDLIVAHRTEYEGWSAGDTRELNALVRDAVLGYDDTAAEAWATYLSHEAAPLRAMAQACRHAEARIRAQCAAQREHEQRTAA